MKKKLPTTRVLLFFDIIKNRLSLLFSVGLIILLFSIPFIVLSVYYNRYIASISLELSDEQIYSTIFTVLNIKNLLFIPASIVLSLALSGVYQIMRRLVFGEGVIIKSDFKKGIKENFYTFMICAIILSILNFIIQYLLFLNVKSDTGYIIALAIIIALIIIVVPVILLVMNQTTIYNLKLSYKFKNGFLLSFRKFYFTYPLGLLNIGLVLLFLIPNNIVYLCLIGLLPLVVSPFIILLNILVNDSILDEFINKEHFPEIYKKGFNYESSIEQSSKDNSQ